MACGEGYGSEVLSRGAASVVGVDANPEAHEHARLRYAAPEPPLRARPGRDPRRAGQLRRGRVPADDRARPGPGGGARALPLAAGAGGVAYVSTPNLLTLAPAGRREVRQPLAHQGVPGRGVPRRCARGVFGEVELLGLFHARKLRVHELALRLGWDAVHTRLRHHQAVLRPLHAGDRRQRLRAARRAPIWTRALDFLAVCR